MASMSSASKARTRSAISAPEPTHSMVSTTASETKVETRLASSQSTACPRSGYVLGNAPASSGGSGKPARRNSSRVAMTIVARRTRAHVVDDPRLIVVYHGMDHQDAAHLMPLPSSPLHPGSHAFQGPGHGPRR